MPSRRHSPSSEFAAAERAFALDAMRHIVAGAMNQAFLGPQAHE